MRVKYEILSDDGVVLVTGFLHVSTASDDQNPGSRVIHTFEQYMMLEYGFLAKEIAITCGVLGKPDMGRFKPREEVSSD